MRAPLCWDTYVTGASLVLQVTSTYKGHPIPHGRGTSPGQGGFGQVGTRHMGTGAGTRGDFCTYERPVRMLPGKAEGLLVWLWAPCANSGKMELRQMF